MGGTGAAVSVSVGSGEDGSGPSVSVGSGTVRVGSAGGGVLKVGNGASGGETVDAVQMLVLEKSGGGRPDP